jgi:hypothetical protein
MAPRHLPASHYLRVYRLRLSMAEDGITQPSPAHVQSMREFVDALTALEPDTLVKLDASQKGVAVFINADTGALLGRFQLGDV